MSDPAAVRIILPLIEDGAENAARIGTLKDLGMKLERVDAVEAVFSCANFSTALIHSAVTTIERNGEKKAAHVREAHQVRSKSRNGESTARVAEAIRGATSPAGLVKCVRGGKTYYRKPRGAAKRGAPPPLYNKPKREPKTPKEPIPGAEPCDKCKINNGVRKLCVSCGAMACVENCIDTRKDVCNECTQRE